MKTKGEKIQENMDLIIKDIEAVFKKHKISGVRPVSLHLESTELKCEPGFKKVCKVYTDPETGSIKVKCRCVKK
jgi:hypothetical protein